MSSNYSLFVILGFLAVVLLLEGLYLLWLDTRGPALQRVRQRLHMMATGEVGAGSSLLVKQRLLSDVMSVHELLQSLRGIERLDRLMLQAGSGQNVAQLLLASAVGGGLTLLSGLVMYWPWLWLLVLPLTVAALPLLRLFWMRANRLQKIGAQLPEALDLISRALRAGHAFSAALAMVGNEAQEPIASEFKTTFDEINFGISTKNALHNLAERVPVPDMRYFVLAVVIQLETGGNLTELLGVLARLIRERFKLFGKIKVLAAEGKMSAIILTALPFFVAASLQMINPGYMNLLFTDPMGVQLLTVALVMMAVGVFLLWRITKIRV